MKARSSQLTLHCCAGEGNYADVTAESPLCRQVGLLQCYTDLCKLSAGLDH